MDCSDCNEVLLIDIEQTQKLYEEAGPIHCECADCQNYYGQVEQLPPACKALFSSMGIDPAKPRELWCYNPSDYQKTSHYSGFFPVVGRISSDNGQGVVTNNWVEYEFVPLAFRLRFERLNTGGLCLGFEADLRLSLPTPQRRGNRSLSSIWPQPVRCFANTILILL